MEETTATIGIPSNIIRPGIVIQTTASSPSQHTLASVFSSMNNLPPLFRPRHIMASGSYIPITSSSNISSNTPILPGPSGSSQGAGLLPDSFSNNINNTSSIFHTPSFLYTGPIQSTVTTASHAQRLSDINRLRGEVQQGQSSMNTGSLEWQTYPSTEYNATNAGTIWRGPSQGAGSLIENSWNQIGENMSRQENLNFQAATTGQQLHSVPRPEETQNAVCRNDNRSANVAPLGALVDTKIKEKIWKDEYVDLNLLIKDNENEKNNTSSQFLLEMSPGGTKKSTKLNSPAKKKDKYITFTKWNMAFSTFVAIYIQKFPQSMSGLMKHQNEVLELYKNGDNWREYDENFRRARATMKWDWEEGSLSLWVKATKKNETSQQNTYDNQNRQQTNNLQQRQWRPRTSPYLQPQRYLVPTGFCKDYHSKGKCLFGRNCIYNHHCPACGNMIGQHPWRYCRNNRYQPYPQTAQTYAQPPQQQYAYNQPYAPTFRPRTRFPEQRIRQQLNRVRYY